MLCGSIAPDMFELWKLNRELHATRKSFAKDRKNLVRRNAPRDEFLALDANEYFLITVIETGVDVVVGGRLLDEARALDVETPPRSDKEMWVEGGAINESFFTPKGRAHVRRLIDEEKERRFNVKTLWLTKLIIPLASLLIGILGALTGLVAVWRHAGK